MKIELTEVTETQKHLLFEVPPEAVAAEIQKVAQGYSRSARVPGFRQGKVPMTVVKQRYKDQILYDVCLLYTSPSPRDRTRLRMPPSA